MEASIPQADTPRRRISISLSTMLRAICFLVIALSVLLGPLYVRGLDPNSKKGKAINRWDMFHYTGNRIRDVEFFMMLPNDYRQPIDYREVLNITTSEQMGWRMSSRSEIRYVANLLCEALGAEEDEIDIRVVSRIGTLDGWVDEFDGSEAMCED